MEGSTECPLSPWPLFINVFQLFFLFFRKNVPDYSASREKNDLGFITFDLQADILCYLYFGVVLMEKGFIFPVSFPIV